MTVIHHCWWQIIVAAIAYWALGAIWFTPKVFGTIWMNSHGIKMNEEDKKKVSMGKLMGLSFVCTLVISTAICWVCCATGCEGMCAPGEMMHCIKVGFLVGCTIAAGISMAYIYQMKPTNAYLTDCGYHIVGSMLAAIVLGLLGCC